MGRFVAAVAALLVASTVWPGSPAEATVPDLLFMKLLEDKSIASQAPERYECFVATGPLGTAEACVDRHVVLRLPLGAVKAVVIERKLLPKDLDNFWRALDDVPPQGSTTSTPRYLTDLSIVFTGESAARLDAFIRQHRGEYFDMRVGDERVEFILFGEQPVTSQLRVRLADDWTDRLRKLFAPLGDRVSVRR